MKIIVGITGASGSIYAVSLIKALYGLSVDVSVVLSKMGEKVLDYECGIKKDELSKWAKIYDDQDLFAPIASGSFLCGGMVISPCSMNTLSAVANGFGETLLHRAAGVALKEGRKLIAVVRETPYSLIHVENMAKLIRAGGCVLPASPGFYHRPTEIWQLVEGITGRVLDQLAIPHELGGRWKGGGNDAR